MVDLSGVHKVTVKGRTYYYAWRGKGAPRLTGAPGSPEFVASLERAHSSRKSGDKTRLSGLCAMFRASDEWRGVGPNAISAKTRASWTLWLDRIQKEFGELRVEAFDRPAMRRVIIKWRNQYAGTPRAADMGMQVFSRLLSFGMEEGRLMSNVCFGVPRIYSVDRSDLIWTEEDLAKLAKHASPEVMQAARLAALTGLRQADLLKLCWSHVGANAIEIRTGKSGGRKIADVPLYGALRELLATIPTRGITVLVNTDGDRWKTGFGSSWRRATKAAGLDHLHFHDLRGTAATRLYMGGLKIREIALVMAWSEDQVEALIDRYVKRDEILLDRIRRLDENASRTPAVKPGVKPAS